MIEKSLKKNMVLNAVKGLASVLFPLITFTYISKILGVDNIGRYSFASSVVNYLILLGGLGISQYAIRDGARIRDNKEKIERFSSEVFTINIYSTIISYLVLFFLLATVPKFSFYKSLLLILSIQILFKTIGVEWIYSIYEDYRYISIVSVGSQAVALVLLFLFVKTKEDVDVYATTTVLPVVSASIMSFFYARKYCYVSLKAKTRLIVHAKPILTLFAMAATVLLYVSSDIIMLGFLCNDYRVGIYSVSTKIYTVVKTVLSSVLVVSIPRISSQLGNNDISGFTATANSTYKTLIFLAAPAIGGLIVLRREVIMLLSTLEYIEATSSLLLLCVALLLCMGAWFWGQCILVPQKKEGIVFRITIASATINILMNLILIPLWKENAAAFTTIIAEGFALICCQKVGRKYVKIEKEIEFWGKILVGCVVIIAIGAVVHMYCLSGIFSVLVFIPIATILYILVEYALGNEVITSYIMNHKNLAGHE